MSAPEVHGTECEPDDLDLYLHEQLEDPAFRAAYEDAANRAALLRAAIERRKSCELSQAEVAARMGTTQSAVSDLERGAIDPRISTLQRYARAVGCLLWLELRAECSWSAGSAFRSWSTVPLHVHWQSAERAADVYSRRLRLVISDSATGEAVLFRWQPPIEQPEMQIREMEVREPTHYAIAGSR